MTKLVALLVALSACCVAAAARAGEWSGVPVLMYHKVSADVPSDAVGRDLTVLPEAFEAQLRYLRDHHIRTLTAAALAETLARGKRPSDVVVLTFDDGYEDAATTALPLLEKYGAQATFYVSAGFVGTPRHLTWREIRTMRAAGMELACHGTQHLDLSTLDRAGQMHEAQHCVDTFARYLGGFRPATYAYPAGKYDATTLDIMHRLGFLAAFTERPGTVHDLSRPWELPRLRIRHDDVLSGFASLVNP